MRYQELALVWEKLGLGDREVSLTPSEFDVLYRHLGDEVLEYGCNDKWLMRTKTLIRIQVDR